MERNGTYACRVTRVNNEETDYLGTLTVDEECTIRIEIKEVENEKTIVFEVKVAEEDFGKIIGRQGKIAQSIRTVMRAVANRKDKKVTVEFIG